MKVGNSLSTGKAGDRKGDHDTFDINAPPVFLARKVYAKIWNESIKIKNEHPHFNCFLKQMILIF
jgi:hypothetical protein